MSDHHDDGPSGSPEARRLLVTDARGIHHDGWAIGSDLVAVRSASLAEPVSVEIDGLVVVAVEIHTTTRATDSADSTTTWSALALPSGCLPVGGEHVPPGFEVTGLDGRSGLSVRGTGTRHGSTASHGSPSRHDEASTQGRNFWCSVFPKAPGC